MCCVRAAWTGAAKVWSVPDCKQTLLLRAHDGRCTDVAWHPSAGGAHAMDEGPASTVALATASADATARLWSADGALLRTLTGHTARLARLAFHPTGRLLVRLPFFGAGCTRR
jgi:U4/U6 small nuclear ribonucleoprotein PRP4